MKTARESLLSAACLRLLIPFSAGYFLSNVLGSANSILAPMLVSTFSLSPANLGLMTAAYLIGFGLAQFPLGVFLDRYGARHTLPPLLVIAGVGAACFAASESFLSLVTARFLLGVGLSGALMSAFSAYRDWLPAERLPLIFSIQSFSGGIGGICATKPVSIAAGLIGWRGVFWFLALCTVATSLAVWIFVPSSKKKSGSTTVWRQTVEMLRLTLDRRILLFAPAVTCVQGVLFAVFQLWVGPWMLDVGGYSHSAAGTYLMLSAAGTAVGYLIYGILADWLHARKIMTPSGLYLLDTALFTVVLAAIAIINSPAATLLWPVAGVLATVSMVSFPIMAQSVESEIAGRALSLLNFGIFAMSFAMQWLVGLILNIYPVQNGHFDSAGYRMALGILAAICFMSTVHLAMGLRKK